MKKTFEYDLTDIYNRLTREPPKRKKMTVFYVMRIKRVEDKVNQ